MKSRVFVHSRRSHHCVKHIRYIDSPSLWASSRAHKTIPLRQAADGSDSGPTTSPKRPSSLDAFRLGRSPTGAAPRQPSTAGLAGEEPAAARPAERQPPRRYRDAPPPGCGCGNALAAPCSAVPPPAGRGPEAAPPATVPQWGLPAGAASARHSAHGKEPRPKGSGSRRGAGRGGCDQGFSCRRGRRWGRAGAPSEASRSGRVAGPPSLRLLPPCPCRRDHRRGGNGRRGGEGQRPLSVVALVGGGGVG